jgi:hypothetical protein
MLKSSKLALIATVVALPLAAQSKHWVNPNGQDAQRSIVDSVNFETDTAIVVNGHVTIACVAEAAKQDPTLFVEVDGYADGRGGDTYNRRLSKARAQSVTEYLAALGAPTDRLRAVGMGKAGLASDPVTNFAQRKAIIVLHRGSFDGELVKQIPTEGLPCASVSNGELPMGRIESNGQTFLVSVDYAKIRSDFRAEVGRMIAEQRVQAVEDGEDQGDPSAENGSTVRSGMPADQARGTNNGGSARGMAGKGASTPAASSGDDERDFRLGLFGLKTDLKDSEKAIGSFEAAGLFRTAGGGIQTGIQGEFGSYRRKLQVDLAYSAVASRFQATFFASIATMSGAPIASAIPYPNQNAFMGGVRLGYEGDVVHFGAFGAQAASSQGSGPLPEQAARGAAGLDFGLTGSRFSLGLMGFSSLGAQSGTTSATLTNKTGGKLDFGVRFGDRFQLLLRAEALPIYDTFSAKRETRIGLGFRIGGIGGARLPNWVEVPTARMIFPY